MTCLDAARVAAQQSPLRVVLVEPDEHLRHAVEAALEPWGMSVLPVASGSPGATMPSSAERGRALARTHDAEAVVWISRSEDGHAVWVYDGRQDRVIARPLPDGPPFDRPTAAEVALIVKTLLRQGPVARPLLRPASRDGIEDASPGPSEAAPGVRATARRAREWTLMTSVGARFAATAPDRAETRFVLWLTIWPVVLDGHLGVGLSLASGPGLAVGTPELSAHWTETALMLTLRSRLHLGDAVDLGATLGAGAHLTTLDGTLSRSGQAASVLRSNPLLAIDLVLGLRLDERLRVEARAGSSFPLRTQTYLVGEATGFELMPANVRALLSAEIAIF